MRRQRRTPRRRPSNRTRPFRSIARALNKPLVRLRPRTTLKPRGPSYNSLSIQCFRRFVAYPSSGVKPAPDKPAPKSSWWLDKLEWYGSLALQLLGTFISNAENDEPAFAVTGAGTQIYITPAFLLFNTAIASTSGNDVSIPFEQARVTWVRITVNPIVDSSVRGGSYVGVLAPIEPGTLKSDVANSFDKLCLQPGAVVRPMTKPLSLTWSPTAHEYSTLWHQIGDTKEQPQSRIAVFSMAFSDMALAKADPGGKSSLEYNPGKSGFELYIEGCVLVRRPGTSVLDANNIHQYADPTIIAVHGHHRQQLIPFSDVEWKDGLATFQPPLSIDDLDELTLE